MKVMSCHAMSRVSQHYIPIFCLLIVSVRAEIAVTRVTMRDSTSPFLYCGYFRHRWSRNAAIFCDCGAVYG
jgi:hypothetical protein